MTNTPTLRPRMLRGVRAYLTPVTSQRDRSCIYAAFRAELHRKDETELSPMNPLRREALHDAIFAVEDELESRGGGHPDDPRVLAMNKARNRVAYDLGWNDYP